MAESSCLSVTVSPHGRVLARHLQNAAISELDGHDLTIHSAPPDARGRVYQVPSGQRWTAGPQGLYESRDGGWILHQIKGTEADAGSTRAPGIARSAEPWPLFPVRHGLVLILLRDRLLEFSVEDPSQPRTTVLLEAGSNVIGSFLGLAPARDGGLWISGKSGILKSSVGVRALRTNSEWAARVIPREMGIENLQQPHEDATGGVTMVGESVERPERAVVHLEGTDWKLRPVKGERIRNAWRGVDGTVWACSAESVFWWPEGRQEMQRYEEIYAGQYYDAAVEPGGAFWLATSDGLFRYAPTVWQPPGLPGSLGAQARLLAGDAEGRLLVFDGASIHRISENTHEKCILPAPFSRAFAFARAFYALRTTLILTDNVEQALQLDWDTQQFSLPSRDQPFKPLGMLMDGSLAVLRPRPGAAPGLDRYDGTSFAPLAMALPPEVIGTNYTRLYATRNGELWLAADRGLACYRKQGWVSYDSRSGSGPAEGMHFLQFADGRLWCATRTELWEFRKDSWTALRRTFDQINSMIQARDGSVWVGSNNGLHRFVEGAWLAMGEEDGLSSSAVRDILEDSAGRLWAATSRGLNRHHPEFDPDPPRTRFRPIAEPGESLYAGAAINLSFMGADRWKYTARGRLLFSHRLDEGEWSAFQEQTSLVLPEVLAGKHHFQVRSMDPNGNLETNPAQLEFVVLLPWYKESRLVWIAMLGLAGVLFFAALAVNRHRRLLRSYAEVERKVSERTRELALANQELLQSQKMKALGTLAAGIAHDFNNILSIVKGSAQIIEDNLENAPKIRTRVDRIKTVVDQGSGIVQAMLGFSRDGDAETVECDLNAVVNETLKLLGDRFLREVRIRFEPTEALPKFPGRPGFIQQILLNFVFNAAESMAGRKEIILKTSLLEDLPRSLALPPGTASSYLCVSVRDFGAGIAPEILPRIFEPFFTTKALSTRRGTGLGLSMAYELAVKMKAGLAVTTQMSEGSTFSLILPVTQEPRTTNLTTPKAP